MQWRGGATERTDGVENNMHVEKLFQVHQPPQPYFAVAKSASPPLHAMEGKLFYYKIFKIN
jgi:hypothetical protein